MKKIILLILPFLLLQSCANMALRVMGILNEEAKIESFSNDGGKEVVWIPMKHIATQDFYANVRQVVDSFTSQGFVVLYEGAKPSFDDSLRMDTLERTFRKIMGMKVGSGYIDSANQVIAGKIEYKGKKTLMNQPSYSRLGVDMDKAVRVDVASDSLLYMFDQKYEIPELDSCDFSTPLQAEYTCESMAPTKARYFMKEYILDHRNRHLANYILEAETPKMLVIYGKLHIGGTFDELAKVDPSWVREK